MLRDDPPVSQPNIVVILCDDLGYGDCSCYGQQSWTTPEIDRMAAGGLRFTDFYTTSPVCSPARASLLTGLHSGRLPIRHLGDPYLPDSVPTIPWLLKPQGYVSACIGKYGVGSGQPDVDPLRKGFDYHYGYNCMRHAHNYFPPFLRENGLRVPLRNRPPEGDTRQWQTGVGVAEVKVDYSPDFIEARALEFIRDCADRPFFLHYCPTLPHANNEGGDTPDGMEVDRYGDFADRDWEPNEKGFARMVQRIDQSVGRILETLRELGIAEKTLVLFTSDNGPHNEGGHSVTRFDSAAGFQGYKRSLHEGGIRIPFIAWMPGTVAPGISDHLGYFPDLLPTFCELAGTVAPTAHDGLSLAPLLAGRGTQARHGHLFFEFENQIAVRSGNWKYYRGRRGPEPCAPDVPNDDEALYDLAADRHEDRDLKAEHPEVLRELKTHVVHEHREYTPDPVPPAYEPRRSLNRSEGINQ
jgi:arylsulfatase A-like enzyme